MLNRVVQLRQSLTLQVVIGLILSIIVSGHMMASRSMMMVSQEPLLEVTMQIKTWSTKHLENKSLRTLGKGSIAACLHMDKQDLVKVILW